MSRSDFRLSPILQRKSAFGQQWRDQQQGRLVQEALLRIEEFVPAGKAFSECRRHKNLPTEWKSLEPIPRTGGPDKKRSA
jgi:hypothetical protein